MGTDCGDRRNPGLPDAGAQEGASNGGRYAVDPALVVPEQLAAPISVVEGRLGRHGIGLEVGTPVVAESVAVGELGVDAADGGVEL